VRVRQAVNYAVDRSAVIKVYGGPSLGTPTCQVLPPGFPGYQPYCPYTRNPSAGHWSAPNLGKARQLVAASHTRGMAVSFYTQSDAVNRGIGEYMVDLLNSLGYKASLKTLSTNAFVGVVSNSNFKAPAFGYAWYQDYPAASDFINNQFSCSSFTPHSSANIDFSEYCDPAVDAGINHAFALEAANNPAAANRVWASLDRRITDQAPWVPLFTPKLVDFVSKNVGNYQFNPLWYFLVDQAWVH
jgi:peptide/nickel transport system substrate-binding protein